MSKSGGSVLEKKCLAWGVGGLIFIEMSRSGGGVVKKQKKNLAWVVGGLIKVAL